MATVTISSYTSGSGTTGIGTGFSSFTKTIIEPTTIPLFSTINSIKVTFTHTTAKGALTAGSVTGSRWALLQTPDSYPTKTGLYHGMSSGSALNTKSHGNGTLHAGHSIGSFLFEAQVSSSATYVRTNKVEGLKVTYDYTPPEHIIKLATRKGQTGTDDNFNPKYSDRLFTGFDNGDGTATITLDTSIVKYTNYVFDCWEDGSTDPVRTIPLTEDATFVAIYRPKRYTVNYYDFTSGEEVLIEQQICDCDVEYNTIDLISYSGALPEGHGVNPQGWVMSKTGNIKDNGYMYQSNLTTVLTQYTSFKDLSTVEGGIVNFYFGFYPKQYQVNYVKYTQNNLNNFTTSTTYRLYGNNDLVLTNLPTPTVGYKLTNQINRNETSINTSITNEWFLSNDAMNPGDEKISIINANYADNITVYSYEIPIQYTVNYYNFSSGEEILYNTQICNYNENYTMPNLPIIETIPEGYAINPEGWVTTKNGNIKNNTTTMYLEDSATEILPQYTSFINLSSNDGDIFNYYFGLYPIQYSITYHNLKEKTLEGPVYTEYRIYNNGDYVLSNLPADITNGYKLTNQMINAESKADPTITNSWFTSIDNLNPEDLKITYIESNYANDIDVYSYEIPNSYIVNYYDFTSGEDILIEQQICEYGINYEMPLLPTYEDTVVGYRVNPNGWTLEKNGNIRNNTTTMYFEDSTTEILPQYTSFSNLSSNDGDIFNYYFGLYPIQYSVIYHNLKEKTLEGTTFTEHRIYDNGDYILSDLPTDITNGYKLTNQMNSLGDIPDPTITNSWFTSIDNLNPEDLKVTYIESNYANDIDVYSYETPNNYIVKYYDFTSGEDVLVDQQICEYGIDYEMPMLPIYEDTKVGYTINPSGWVDTKVGSIRNNTTTMYSGESTSTILPQYTSFSNLSSNDGDIFNYYFGLYPIQYSVVYRSFTKNTTTSYSTSTYYRIYNKADYNLKTLPTSCTAGYKLSNKMLNFGDAMDSTITNSWFTSIDNLNPGDPKISIVESQVAEDIMVYSYETPIDYQIYFHVCDYDNEELQTHHIKTKYEEEIESPSKPEEIKEGRNVFGWYKNQQNISTWYISVNSDTSISGATATQSLNFNYKTKNLSTVDQSEVHYYAYYIPKAYSISYKWLDDWNLNSYSLPAASTRIYGRTEYSIPLIPEYDKYYIDNVGTNQWYYFENDNKELERQTNTEEILSLSLAENRVFYANKFPKPRHVNFSANDDSLGGVYINKSVPNEDGFLEGSTLEVYAKPGEKSSFQSWGDGSKNPIKLIEIKDQDLEYTLNFRDESKSVGIVDLYKGNGQVKGVFQKDNLIFQNAKIPYRYKEPTYTITNLNSSYPFKYNSSTGYYVSSNKGVHNSYSLCQINITTTSAAMMYVDCINYAESNYDYGILSHLNKDLGKNYNAEKYTSTTVKHTFYGKSSSAVQTVSYELPKKSTVFIQIKYRKDQSQNSNNDTLQFKIRFKEINN